MRTLLARRWIDGLLDYTRFKIDSFPSLDYQPLPWLGLAKARRDAGVESRWREIDRVVSDVGARSAMDIGCNVGYFAIALAMRGLPVIGIEESPKYYRLMQYAVRRLGLEEVGGLSFKLTPRTVSLLPCADCVIFLSVWHHLVRAYGMQVATEMLQVIWSKAETVMFFETGETEMPAEYRLPNMAPDPGAFIAEYLEEACASARIKHLGCHDAFAPNGRRVSRNLFSLTRQR